MTSLFTFFQSIGGIFGIAIMGAILNNQLSAGLANVDLHGIPIFAVRNNATLVANLLEPLKSEVMGAYVIALDTVYLTLIPLAACGFLSTLLIRQYAMRTTMGANTVAI